MYSHSLHQLSISHTQGQCVSLLNALITREVAQSSFETLFRGNSLTTKAVDVYMKMIGHEYLQMVLSDTIRTVFATKHSCEIDPSKLQKGESVAANAPVLLNLLRQVITNIFTSSKQVHSEEEREERESVCKS